MKGHERREAGLTEEFFKLDRHDERIGAFRPTKGRYATVEEARSAASSPGRYRVVACDGRKAIELEPFTV